MNARKIMIKSKIENFLQKQEKKKNNYKDRNDKIEKIQIKLKGLKLNSEYFSPLLRPKNDSKKQEFEKIKEKAQRLKNLIITNEKIQLLNLKRLEKQLKSMKNSNEDLEEQFKAKRQVFSIILLDFFIVIKNLERMKDQINEIKPYLSLKKAKENSEFPLKKSNKNEEKNSALKKANEKKENPIENEENIEEILENKKVNQNSHKIQEYSLGKQPFTSRYDGQKSFFWADFS